MYTARLCFSQYDITCLKTRWEFSDLCGLSSGIDTSYCTPPPTHLFLGHWQLHRDGPGIESRLGEIFRPSPGPGAHPASCTMGTGSFPGVKYGWGVLLTTHPLPVPRSRKGRATPLPTLWATTGPVTVTLLVTPATPRYSLRC